MSDTKLRDLERRWKETGTVEDEAAYLLERVRVGDLTRERLRLAAYCGHEGASRAIGDDSAKADATNVLAALTANRRGAATAAEAFRAALDVCGAAFERAGELTPSHRTSTPKGEVEFTARRLGVDVEQLAAETLRHLADRVLGSW